MQIFRYMAFLLMLIDKLYSAEDLARMNQEIDPRYIEAVTENTPEYLLTVMAQIVEGLLLKLNVPMEEAEDLAGQIKERRMGEWCANFKGYDVQETRRKVREETEKETREKTEKETREKDLVRAIRMMKEVGVSRKDTEEQLVKQFELEPQEAEKILQANW